MVQRGMWYLSRAVAIKWAPGQLVHARCAAQGYLSYALPGQVRRRDQGKVGTDLGGKEGETWPALKRRLEEPGRAERRGDGHGTGHEAVRADEIDED